MALGHLPDTSRRLVGLLIFCLASSLLFQSVDALPRFQLCDHHTPSVNSTPSFWTRIVSVACKSVEETPIVNNIDHDKHLINTVTETFGGDISTTYDTQELHQHNDHAGSEKIFVNGPDSDLDWFNDLEDAVEEFEDKDDGTYDLDGTKINAYIDMPPPSTLIDRVVTGLVRVFVYRANKHDRAAIATYRRRQADLKRREGMPVLRRSIDIIKHGLVHLRDTVIEMVAEIYIGVRATGDAWKILLGKYGWDHPRDEAIQAYLEIVESRGSGDDQVKAVRRKRLSKLLSSNRDDGASPTSPFNPLDSRSTPPAHMPDAEPTAYDSASTEPEQVNETVLIPLQSRADHEKRWEDAQLFTESHNSPTDSADQRGASKPFSNTNQLPFHGGVYLKAFKLPPGGDMIIQTVDFLVEWQDSTGAEKLATVMRIFAWLAKRVILFGSIIMVIRTPWTREIIYALAIATFWSIVLLLQNTPTALGTVTDKLAVEARAAWNHMSEPQRHLSTTITDDKARDDDTAGDIEAQQQPTMAETTLYEDSGFVTVGPDAEELAEAAFNPHQEDEAAVEFTIGVSEPNPWNSPRRVRFASSAPRDTELPRNAAELNEVEPTESNDGSPRKRVKKSSAQHIAERLERGKAEFCKKQQAGTCRMGDRCAYKHMSDAEMENRARLNDPEVPGGNSSTL